MIKYVIADMPINQSQIDACIQTSIDSARKSVDGTKALLKYRGFQPSSLLGLTEYNKEQIKDILKGPEWTDPNAGF